MGAVRISEATEVSEELIDAFARLIPQLSSSSPAPDAAALAGIVASPATVLLIARLVVDGEESGDIVGTLTLVIFMIPTASRAIIEDVVVDESARGRGVGEALTVAALDRARDAGARTVDLTSRPSREAANRLYERLGFMRRDTNVWRFDLGPGA